MAAPSIGMFKARLDGTLSSLGWWEGRGNFTPQGRVLVLGAGDGNREGLVVIQGAQAVS